MLIGVQQAQEHGVRVHLLGICPQQGGNLSQFLLNEADQVHHWDADTVREFDRSGWKGRPAKAA